MRVVFSRFFRCHGFVYRQKFELLVVGKKLAGSNFEDAPFAGSGREGELQGGVPHPRLVGNNSGSDPSLGGSETIEKPILLNLSC